MRPQHDAAENTVGWGIGECSTSASMRPQHDAAENTPAVAPPLATAAASMRPQHDAAENDRRAVALRPGQRLQ